VIHGGEIDQALEAAPQDGDARAAVACAPQEAPHLADPAHGLGERGRGRGELGGLVDVAVEGLPLALLQQRGAGGVGQRARMVA
jgi:hypothetical protein